MMSKAAYLMQDHIRRSYSLITEVHSPSLFFVRGRVPFPQGLLALGTHLHGKVPADLYAHPYFVEKQSMPSQPSPQMQLTEELQGLFRVTSGLLYRTDEAAKLDNTMTFASDFDIPVTARMIRLEEVDGEEGRRKRAAAGLRPGIAGSDLKRLSLMSGVVSPNSRSAGNAGGEVRGMAMSGMGSGGRGQRLGAKDGSEAQLRERFPLARWSMSRRENWNYFTMAMTTKLMSAELNARAAIPETAEEMFATTTGAYTVLYNPIAVNDNTFQDLIVRLRREMKVVTTIVVPARHAWRHVQLWADAFPDAEIISSCPIPRFPEQDAAGGEAGAGAGAGAGRRGDKAGAAATGHQLLDGAVCGIVFPDATPEELASCSASGRDGGGPGSGAARSSVPGEGSDKDERGSTSGTDSQPSAATRAAALTAEEEEAEERRALRDRSRLRRKQQQQEKQQAREKSEAEKAAAVAKAQAAVQAASANDAEAAAREAAAALYRSELGKDEIDSLWLRDSAFSRRLLSVEQLDTNRDANTTAGLRAEELDGRTGRRVRVLAEENFPAAVATRSPNITLHHIAGDRVSEEYVLYEASSGALSVVELYHGTYADFDPASTWLSRVWFKFMKRGDYKRDDLVPRDKYMQVLRQGAWEAVRASVDALTRPGGFPLPSPDEKYRASLEGGAAAAAEAAEAAEAGGSAASADSTSGNGNGSSGEPRRGEIKMLIYAHGTSPQTHLPRNRLRNQWNLGPVEEKENSSALDFWGETNLDDASADESGENTTYSKSGSGGDRTLVGAHPVAFQSQSSPMQQEPPRQHTEQQRQQQPLPNVRITRGSGDDDGESTEEDRRRREELWLSSSSAAALGNQGKPAPASETTTTTAATKRKKWWGFMG